RALARPPHHAFRRNCHHFSCRSPSSGRIQATACGPPQWYSAEYCRHFSGLPIVRAVVANSGPRRRGGISGARRRQIVATQIAERTAKELASGDDPELAREVNVRPPLARADGEDVSLVP